MKKLICKHCKCTTTYLKDDTEVIDFNLDERTVTFKHYYVCDNEYCEKYETIEIKEKLV